MAPDRVFDLEPLGRREADVLSHLPCAVRRRLGQGDEGNSSVMSVLQCSPTAYDSSGQVERPMPWGTVGRTSNVVVRPRTAFAKEALLLSSNSREW